MLRKATSEKSKDHRCGGASLLASRQVLAEEGRQLVERDHIDLVVKVGVVRARNDHQFLGLRRGRVGGLAEVARVGLLAVDRTGSAAARSP